MYFNLQSFRERSSFPDNGLIREWNGNWREEAKREKFWDTTWMASSSQAPSPSKRGFSVVSRGGLKFADTLPWRKLKIIHHLRWKWVNRKVLRVTEVNKFLLVLLFKAGSIQVFWIFFYTKKSSTKKFGSIK